MRARGASGHAAAARLTNTSISRGMDGRQPARASVLVAVFERADPRDVFFGVGLRAGTAIDVANTSRSAASQCCSDWPCTQPCAAQIS